MGPFLSHYNTYYFKLQHTSTKKNKISVYLFTLQVNNTSDGLQANAALTPGMLHVGPEYPAAQLQVLVLTQAPWSQEGSQVTDMDKRMHIHTA